MTKHCAKFKVRCLETQSPGNCRDCVTDIGPVLTRNQTDDPHCRSLCLPDVVQFLCNMLCYNIPDVFYPFHTHKVGMCNVDIM